MRKRLKLKQPRDFDPRAQTWDDGIDLYMILIIWKQDWHVLDADSDLYRRASTLWPSFIEHHRSVSESLRWVCADAHRAAGASAFPGLHSLLYLQAALVHLSHSIAAYNHLKTNISDANNGARSCLIQATKPFHEDLWIPDYELHKKRRWSKISYCCT